MMMMMMMMYLLSAGKFNIILARMSIRLYASPRILKRIHSFQPYIHFEILSTPHTKL